ncbi:MAG: response regulator [bacterium]
MKSKLSRQSQKTFRALMAGTASSTGVDFFDALIKNLCELEEMDYGFICQVNPVSTRAHVLSMWHKGKIKREFEKDLRGSASEKTISEGFSCYHKGIQELFPRRQILKGLKLESYIGIPLKTGKGKVIGILSVLHSKPIRKKPYAEEVFQIFSQRAVAEIQRLEAEKALLYAQKMELTGQLAAKIAHKFDNHLQVIIGNISKIKRKTEKESGFYHDIIAIEKSSDKASELARRLLGLSRKEEINLQVLDLNHVLSETSALLEASLPNYIEIKTDFSPEPLITEGDYDQLEQVILNLCLNARDAMNERGVLKIVTRMIDYRNNEGNGKYPGLSPGKYACLTISDTGHGMDEETAGKIFEPFFTTKPKDRGTGLGLAMVYGAIQNHRGRIYVNSKTGQGTCFKIFLKARRKALTRQVEEKNVREPGVNRENKTVLLVDDEEIVREVTREMLVELGYKVLLAQDGAGAVELYQEKGADLVLMDHNMPRMMGMEASREILRLNPRAKIIITSGYVKEGLYNEKEWAGISDFLKKPYNIRTLSQKIKHALDL